MLNGTVRESRNGLSYLWLYPEMRNDRGHQKQELIYVVLPQPWDGEEPEQNTIWYPAGSQLQITGLLELPEPGCRRLAEVLRDRWAARWPKDSYHIVEAAELQKGFRYTIMGIEVSLPKRKDRGEP